MIKFNDYGMPDEFRFTICEGDYGTGILLDDAPPHFDPVDAMGAAHDVMEHCDLGGTLENEFEAFGAMHYVRGDTYSVIRGNGRGAAANSAYEIFHIICEAWYKGEELSTLIPSLPDSHSGHNGLVDSEHLKEIYGYVESEMSYGFDDEYKGKEFRTYFRRALRSYYHYLHAGFKKAEYRYRNAHNTVIMFCKLEDKLALTLKYNDYENQRYVATWNNDELEYVVESEDEFDYQPDEEE